MNFLIDWRICMLFFSTRSVNLHIRRWFKNTALLNAVKLELNWPCFACLCANRPESMKQHYRLPKRCLWSSPSAYIVDEHMDRLRIMSECVRFPLKIARHVESTGVLYAYIIQIRLTIAQLCFCSHETSYKLICHKQRDKQALKSVTSIDVRSYIDWRCLPNTILGGVRIFRRFFNRRPLSWIRIGQCEQQFPLLGVQGCISNPYHLIH